MNIIISFIFVMLVAGVAKAQDLTQEQLISNLLNGNDDQRRDAARELGRGEYRNNREIVPALLLALENDKYIVRTYAAEALANNRNEIAFVNLAQVAGNKTSEGQAEALRSLERSPNKERTIPLFVENINSEDRDVRIAAARGLAQHGQDERAFQAMRTHLNSTDNSIAQDYVAEGIRRSQNPESMNILIAVLANQDSGAREYAADELGEFNDPQARLALFQATYDSDSRVVSKAIQGLEEEAKTNEDILNRFIELYQVNEGNLVGTYALDAILETKNVKIKTIAEQALNSRSSSTQSDALEALKEIGDRSSLIGIIDLMGSDVRSVRREAHEAFRAIMRRNFSEDEFQAIAKCLPQGQEQPYSEGTKSAALLLDIFTMFMSGATYHAATGTVTNYEAIGEDQREALKSIIEQLIPDEQLKERRITSVQ